MNLLFFVLAYGTASLLHHLHNAVFVDAYPNLPAWLTAAHVYAAWLAVTSIGIVGYVLHRRGHRTAGLISLAIYGALGFYGLAHYAVAPLAAHTAGMHATILAEVLTALLLLIAIAIHLKKRQGPA